MINLENKYTSTGIKFWKHPKQLKSYRLNQGSTIITTHISPESLCNLNCEYCSVKNRERNLSLDINKIKDYVIKLQSRGLKAVILTGGGEPTLYKQFNELVRWIKIERDLSIALITNGTLQNKVEKDVWSLFSWIRISINHFEGYESKIFIPFNYVNDDCVIGCSYVCSTAEDINNLELVSKIANKVNATYIRVLPNCLVNEYSLMNIHSNIEEKLKTIDDKRFFRQNKIFKAPNSLICHQSYFRPYLSEVDWKGNGISGSVYPCDSVVLNNSMAKFDQKYQICQPENILDYLDNKIENNINPCNDCKNCVFFKNIEMLDNWKNGTPLEIPENLEDIDHEEFV